MRTPMLSGNWKMFKTLAEAKDFAASFAQAVQGMEGREILICPPYPYLATLAEAWKDTPIHVGAENIFWEDEGAYTGEVSGPMIASCGATFALVGHSERRQYFDETDETVNKRINAAFKHNLTPVVCVGETLEERESGNAMDVISTQIKDGLQGLNTDQAAQLLIAYEPVWAIGTGKTATPEIAQEVHAHIRAQLAEIFGKDTADKIRILYGGSVKPGNVDELMAKPDIDGTLVGGASLDVASFERIVKFKG